MTKHRPTEHEPETAANPPAAAEAEPAPQAVGAPDAAEVIEKLRAELEAAKDRENPLPCGTG